ncbi:MAG TPA: hypothetical protein VF494_12420 [Candidatus Limnocylindrales bacterium]
MTDPLRRAGAGTLADGSQLVWSVADGRRGRRWRAVASVDGAITHALLLEIDTAGRPSRLELTTPAGLLTLHPEEGSGELHGNVVTVSGVRHLALPWSEAHGLEVDGRPLAAAVTAHRLAGSTAVGEGRTVLIVAISADLDVTAGNRRYDRVGEGEWRIATIDGHVAPVRLAIDERGVPILPGDAPEWPLELD